MSAGGATVTFAWTDGEDHDLRSGDGVTSPVRSEWFLDLYTNELDMRGRVEQGRQLGDIHNEGGRRASCMTGGACIDGAIAAPSP